MSARTERRYTLAHPIKVYGQDANGESFYDSVTTLDLCARGVRISQVRRDLLVGQELFLQHKNQRVRFRVVWLGHSGPLNQQIGLVATDLPRKVADFTKIFIEKCLEPVANDAATANNDSVVSSLQPLAEF